MILSEKILIPELNPIKFSRIAGDGRIIHMKRYNHKFAKGDNMHIQIRVSDEVDGDIYLVCKMAEADTYNQFRSSYSSITKEGTEVARVKFSRSTLSNGYLFGDAEFEWTSEMDCGVYFFEIESDALVNIEYAITKTENLLLGASNASIDVSKLNFINSSMNIPLYGGLYDVTLDFFQRGYGQLTNNLYWNFKVQQPLNTAYKAKIYALDKNITADADETHWQLVSESTLQRGGWPLDGYVYCPFVGTVVPPVDGMKLIFALEIYSPMPNAGYPDGTGQHCTCYFGMEYNNKLPAICYNTPNQGYLGYSLYGKEERQYISETRDRVLASSLLLMVE